MVENKLAIALTEACTQTEAVAATVENKPATAAGVMVVLIASDGSTVKNCPSTSAGVYHSAAVVDGLFGAASAPATAFGVIVASAIDCLCLEVHRHHSGEMGADR